MRSRVDVAIVGGGIVGLATALRLTERRPEVRVTVLERDNEVGTGQSSRNSGVLHAGVYYPPGSAKARWCRAGKAAFEQFAAEHDIPVKRTGKVVAAVERRELPGLRRLVERARANGVEIHELDADALAEREPHLTAIAGAWTPETAVTDFGAACHRMAEVLRDRGVEVRTGTRVERVDERDDHVRLHVGDEPDGENEVVQASVAVVCVGLDSDRFGERSGRRPAERIMPFRGSWLRLRDASSELVRGSIYPVPLPGLPFLGVHLTRRIDGSVWIGPNAVLALAREGRSPWSLEPRDVADVLKFPGTWRLARRNLPTAVTEVVRDRSIRANLREVRRYVPDIGPGDVERGPWGVRAQLVDRSGNLVDDFVVRDTPRTVHVLNAPSPAATASFAIGDEITSRALDHVPGPGRHP